VHPGASPGPAAVEPQRRLALRTEAHSRFVARAEHVAERCERGFVEAHARVDALHLQADVIEHAMTSLVEVSLEVERPGELFLEDLAVALRLHDGSRSDVCQSLLSLL